MAIQKIVDDMRTTTVLDAAKLTGTVSYGENYESERHLDLSNHYFAEDPLADDDPSFVSLVKK
jgi:hypothetical protein